MKNTEEASTPEPRGEAKAEEKIQAPGAPKIREETRSQRFLRLALRWLAGVLIIFALGVLGTVLLLYQPAREKLSEAQIGSEEANQRIKELESEVARLKSLENKNQTLEKELKQAQLHILILSALSDINAAHLALAQEDQAAARAHLTKTPETLNELARLVSPDQQEMVGAMQNRLELAVEELERDAFAAESDLQVLATNLVQLENILFRSSISQ